MLVIVMHTFYILLLMIDMWVSLNDCEYLSSMTLHIYITEFVDYCCVYVYIKDVTDNILNSWVNLV